MLNSIKLDNMNIKTLRMAGSIALAALVSACANPVEPYDAVYITQAQESMEIVLSVDVPPATTSFSVSSSVKATENVVVDLKVVPEEIEAYNSKYGKNYKMAPEGTYSLSALSATIEAGYNVSDDIDVTINSIEGFETGSTYCIPVSISSVSSMQVLEPSKTVFIVLKTPVASKAIYIGSNRYIVPGFKDDPTLSALKEVTLETMVYVNAFQNSDPYISSIMGIEGTCGVRFGDVKVPKNCVQICHGDYQPAATSALCDSNKWYHIAAVWTGSTWDIYINGQYITGTSTGGETMNLTETGSCGFQLGASYSYGRTLNGYLSEVRVWTRALTQSEIANNMYYVDPSSPGLLAYWKMDSCEDANESIQIRESDYPTTYYNVVRDATGHGYDAYGTSRLSQVQMMDTKWSY